MYVCVFSILLTGFCHLNYNIICWEMHWLRYQRSVYFLYITVNVYSL